MCEWTTNNRLEQVDCWRSDSKIWRYSKRNESNKSYAVRFLDAVQEWIASDWGVKTILLVTNEDLPIADSQTSTFRIYDKFQNQIIRRIRPKDSSFGSRLW